MRKTITRAAAVIFIASAGAGCTSMDAPQTNFLTMQEKNGSDSGNPGQPAARNESAAVANDVVIADVQWLAGETVDITPEEREALKHQLARDLEAGMTGPDAKALGRPVRLRAAITRVVTVSPALNVLGTLLTIGPLDRGGAAIEIVALDGRTGEPLASMKKGYYPPIWNFTARFAKLEPAQLALKELATEFVRDQLHIASDKG